ncbi:cupin domain-containing protein [Paraburkholderia phenoliruptrix]|uniref:cupin domain-containing protein n=1 Tax=Paraburkholderia phenoliruptrix TaxID=252970 RepID=UPI001C6DF214|nr:cupin domain-containing protein [Paraburkholderia phenoliruptrix]MBW9107998.1 cupin domain-containing protein [Paraburkholderia phenoliruptrix]MBW9133317.1 cupin domain-containing protein [Paraburkholderia ginsengiterrae]
MATPEMFSRTHINDIEEVEAVPGIFVKMLHHTDEGVMVRQLRFAPGAVLPMQDTHELGLEMVYVLDGTFADESGSYPAGSILYGKKGSSHIPASPEGCTVLSINFVD